MSKRAAPAGFPAYDPSLQAAAGAASTSSSSAAASSASAASAKRRRAAGGAASASPRETKKATAAAKPPAAAARAAPAEKEKRPAPSRRGSQAFQDRLYRASSQRMYMIDHASESDAAAGLCHRFDVAGSTGNVYVVRIRGLPRCTCPDFARRGEACKHIIFVYLKVLKLPITSSVIPQKGLLQSELLDMFCRLPNDEERELQGVLATARAREAYRRQAAVDGGEEGEEEERQQQQEQQQLLGDVDECPICFDGIDVAKRETLAICQTCSRPVHKDCFATWKQVKIREHNRVACIWCRAEWIEPGAAVGLSPAGKKLVPGARVGEGGYLNVASLTGQSRTRDESTYSEWMHRRRHWHDWDD